MRKLVVSEFVSLDGVMEAPGGDDGYVHGAWTIPYWCDELGEFKTAELFAASTLLLGRVTYTGFAAAWPERSGDPFSDAMNSLHKAVVSTTLEDPSWGPATVLAGDRMIDAVTALKAGVGEGGSEAGERDTGGEDDTGGEGGDILVAGSAQLVHGLLQADLVDELRVAMYPLTLGVGKRLWPDGARLDFTLAESSVTSTGVALLTYRRTDQPADSGQFPDKFRR